MDGRQGAWRTAVLEGRGEKEDHASSSSSSSSSSGSGSGTSSSHAADAPRPTGIAALAAKVKAQEEQQKQQKQQQQQQQRAWQTRQQPLQARTPAVPASQSKRPAQTVQQSNTRLAAPLVSPWQQIQAPQQDQVQIKVNQIQANPERARPQQTEGQDLSKKKETAAPKPKTKSLTTGKPQQASQQHQHPMQGKRRGKKGPKEPTRPMVILPAGADMTTRPVAILSAKRDTNTETGESPSASAASRRPASTSAKLPASVPAKQAKGTSTKKQPVKAAKSVTPPTSKPSTPVPPSPTPVKSPWAHELVDSRFSFAATGSSLPSPLWQAANTQYRVIGALGTQGSGKSALLNALTVSTTSLNPVERARPFVERSRDEKCSIIHKTRGVKAAFCTVGGERVLLLDAQPVLSPSVLYDLVERQANLNLCSSHASLATLHDLQLAVFMLSVCDALFLVESDEDAQTRGLWKLLRFAYLAKGGDAIKDAVADLILVRNEMPMHKIDVAASLAREQELWMSFFSDIVPHAAPHPQLFFCPLASYGDSGLDAQSPEMAFLKHVLLNEIFSSTEHDHKLHEHQRLFGSSAATLHEGTPWWHAASFSDETDPIAAEDYDDFQNASTTHDWDTCPDVGEGFAHLHALLACRQRHPLLTQKSRGTKQSSLPPRMSETEWVDRAARLWLREIPHSIQLREFAVVCDGLLLST